MTWILDGIGVVEMVIDRIGVTYHKTAVNQSKSDDILQNTTRVVVGNNSTTMHS